MRPIFYISSERSGTNFFRNLIHAHSRAYFPHNPSIWEEFEDITDLYTSKEEFVFDVIGLIRFNHDPWNFIPEEEEVLKRLQNIDVIEVIKVIYELCAEHYDVDVVGLKNVNYSKITNRIYNVFDNAKFIHQYRDPRDCAASWLTINSGPKHVYHSAVRWDREQSAVAAVKDELEANGDLLHFSYEGLVSNTAALLPHICEFLGLAFEEGMLEFHKTRDAQKSATMHKAWNNLAKPIMTNNFNKFEKALSPEQIEIIERVAYKNMHALGYELKHPEFLDNPPAPFTDTEIAEFDRINDEKRKENWAKAERNFRKERKDYFRKCLHAKFQKVEA